MIALSTINDVTDPDLTTGAMLLEVAAGAVDRDIKSRVTMTNLDTSEDTTYIIDVAVYDGSDETIIGSTTITRPSARTRQGINLSAITVPAGSTLRVYVESTNGNEDATQEIVVAREAWDIDVANQINGELNIDNGVVEAFVQNFPERPRIQ